MKELYTVILIEFSKNRDMAVRDNEEMAGIDRPDIEEGCHASALIHAARFRITGDDCAEDTIVYGILQVSFMEAAKVRRVWVQALRGFPSASPALILLRSRQPA